MHSVWLTLACESCGSRVVLVGEDIGTCLPSEQSRIGTWKLNVESLHTVPVRHPKAAR